MTILLLAETAGGALAPATAKALTAAKDIGGAVHVLVAGPGLEAAAAEAAKLAGVEKVLLADDPAIRQASRRARRGADRLARARAMT